MPSLSNKQHPYARAWQTLMWSCLPCRLGVRRAVVRVAAAIPPRNMVDACAAELERYLVDIIHNVPVEDRWLVPHFRAITRVLLKITPLTLNQRWAEIRAVVGALDPQPGRHSAGPCTTVPESSHGVQAHSVPTGASRPVGSPYPAQSASSSSSSGCRSSVGAIGNPSGISHQQHVTQVEDTMDSVHAAMVVSAMVEAADTEKGLEEWLLGPSERLRRLPPVPAFPAEDRATRVFPHLAKQKSTLDLRECPPPGALASPPPVVPTNTACSSASTARPQLTPEQLARIAHNRAEAMARKRARLMAPQGSCAAGQPCAAASSNPGDLGTHCSNHPGHQKKGT